MPVTGEQSLASSGRRRRSTFGRIIRWLPLIGVLTLIAVVYFHYFYRFGEGVKSGHLNYVVRKGNVFKTYEGKLIQQGYKTNLQSNEFEFSIANRRLFDSLSLHSGKIFDLHYIEYHGALPWRGSTRYVVDSIIAMHDE